MAYFWCSFLVLWALAQLAAGAVAPWAVAAVVAALAGLNLVMPGQVRLSRSALLFIVGVAGVFALQFAPIPPLFPYTTALREAHETGLAWPGTADTFLTVRSLALITAYVLAALLVVRLRQAGLSTERVLKGICVVLALQAAYAFVQVFAPLADIPFYGPRPYPGVASGTLVNRNSFAGLMAMGFLCAVGLAWSRFSWPGRMRRWEAGLPWALAAALFAAAIALSASRGGAIAALTALAALPFLHRGRASAAGAIVIVLLGATTVIAANPTILLERFSDLGSSQGARWTFWSTTLAAALRQPLLGFGIGTHPVAYHPFQPAEIAGQVHHAHNEYVNAAFEGGAVWIALLLAGMVAWFARARRATRTAQGPDRIVGAAALAAVAAVAVHSLVDFDLQITAVGLLFATLIGTAPRGDAPPRRFVAPAVALVGLAVAAVLAFAPLRALALSPYDHALAWKHAREAQRADSPALADRRFEKAADLWPAHPDLQREAGLWFWEGGQRDRAAKCLRRLFSQRPRDVAGVMDEIWDPERDVAEYEVLLPPGPAARAEMAGALVDRGYWRQGMELFDRGPADAAAFDAFAGALRRAGQWGLEADVRDRRLQMKSDAAAYAAAAQAWSRLDAYERALEHATTATRLDPANAAWHAIKGEILRAHGDRMSALEAVVEAVRLAPRELATRILRARLYVDLEMWGPAAEDVAEITRSRPAFPQSPEAAAARKAAEAYVKRHPDDAAAQGLLRALTP